jgi:formyl-CoA transferase
MGLGDDVLRQARPDLVIAHISGFGQDGPYRDRAAFGVIGEAIGGLRHLTDQEPGMSDLAPVRVGLSVGDSIAGLYAAFGVVSALWQRDRVGGDCRGRNLDVALTDSVLSLTEGMLPEYGALGKVRQPTGSRIPTAAPTSAYRSSDGKWMLIAANSEPLFRRLAQLIGRPDILQEARFKGNQKRVENVIELDEIISAWTNNLSIDELDRRLTEADIPSTRVYSAVECAADPQFRHRGMVRKVEDGLLGPILHFGIVPHVSDNPGTIRWSGPSVGQHTDEVLGEFLSMTPGQLQDLRAEGII